MRRGIVAFLLVGHVLAAPPGAAAREEVVSDTSTDEIDIKLKYHGQDVLVFGTIPEGAGIVVKVSAPPRPESLARKGRVGPFWMTVEKATVENLPALYLLHTQRPLAEMFPRGVPRELDLASMVEMARFDSTVGDARALGEGFVRLKEREGLYVLHEGSVETKKGKVFKLAVPISSKVPPGDLLFEILAVRNGRIVARDRDIVRIEKVGVERWLTDLAFRHPPLYGLLAVGVALLSGFGVSLLFREGGAH
ncbi:MAG: TIGR02186 family protein [Nitrospirae bacterium]|nr:TIGR02186 family protein [Nitrospirota bacterium]